MRYNTFRALGRLAGAAALAAACLLPAAAQQFVPLPQSVIVFPFDKPDNVDQSVADAATTGLRNRMANVTGYEATTFNPKSPLIRRAISAGELTQTQLAGPFDAASAAAIAMAAGVDNALVGSVESASNEGGTASVSISVQLIGARDGQVQKTAGATGTAATAGLAPDALLRAAADDAAAKAVAQVFGSKAGAGADTGAAPATGATTTPPGQTNATAAGEQPNAGVTGTQPGTKLNIPTAPAGLPSGSIPTEGSRKRKSNTGLIIGGLALLGLIIAASGSGGGGGNGGGGNNGGGGPPTFPF